MAARPSQTRPLLAGCGGRLDCYLFVAYKFQPTLQHWNATTSASRQGSTHAVANTVHGCFPATHCLHAFQREPLIASTSISLVFTAHKSYAGCCARLAQRKGHSTTMHAGCFGPSSWASSHAQPSNGMLGVTTAPRNVGCRVRDTSSEGVGPLPSLSRQHTMRVAASSLSVPFEESDPTWGNQRTRDSTEASTSAAAEDKQQRATSTKPLKINLDLALVCRLLSLGSKLWDILHTINTVSRAIHATTSLPPNQCQQAQADARGHRGDSAALHGNGPHRWALVCQSGTPVRAAAALR